MKTASLIRAAAVVAISAMNFSTGAAANPFFLLEELFQPRIEQPRVDLLQGGAGPLALTGRLGRFGELP